MHFLLELNPRLFDNNSRERKKMQKQTDNKQAAYESTNPLTILSRSLRGLALTERQQAILASYSYTETERANVAASIEARRNAR